MENNLAKLLNVDFNEAFRIIDGNEVSDELFYFDEKGLHCYEKGYDGKEIQEMQYGLITGQLKVKHNKYSPKYQGEYWIYDFDDKVHRMVWINNRFDFIYWKLGNCFRTEEEALTDGKQIIDEIKKEYENRVS